MSAQVNVFKNGFYVCEPVFVCNVTQMCVCVCVTLTDSHAPSAQCVLPWETQQ